MAGNVINFLGSHVMTVRATCCRTWELLPLVPIGRCGYCQQRPKVKRTLALKKASPSVLVQTDR